MREMAVHEFRSKLKATVESVIDDHEPLRVTRRSGKSFIVVSEEDWEQEQETLYVLQNQSLMTQIRRSLQTLNQGNGYQPSPEDIDAIVDL